MKPMEVTKLRVNDVVQKKTVLGRKFFLVVDVNRKHVKLARIKKSMEMFRAQLEQDSWKKSSILEAIVYLK